MNSIEKTENLEKIKNDYYISLLRDLADDKIVLIKTEEDYNILNNLVQDLNSDRELKIASKVISDDDEDISYKVFLDYKNYDREINELLQQKNYTRNNFTNHQMLIIQTAFRNGLSQNQISIMFDRNLSAEKMDMFRKLFEKGLSVDDGKKLLDITKTGALQDYEIYNIGMRMVKKA